MVGAYTDIFRGTPVLVQVFVVFFILPEAGIELDSFTAGALALSNITACFISEIVASGIKAVPVGQVEAAASAGLTRLQQLRLIVMPQATRMVVPSLVGQFVLLVKDSSVVSAIGLLDLTRSGWVIVQNIPNGMLVFPWWARVFPHLLPAALFVAKAGKSLTSPRLQGHNKSCHGHDEHDTEYRS